MNGQSDEELASLIEYSIKFYAEHYDLRYWQVRSAGRKTILGPKYPIKCRFCGRSVPDVTFRNEAHAVPQSLGNNTLLTNYECDSCNQKFGDTIENDFGNWFLPRRTFAGLRKNKKYPTLKSRDKLSRLDWTDKGLHVDHPDGSDFFVANEINKTLNFNMDVPSYIPNNVWKTFVKIGLSLIEEDKIKYFADAIAWIMDKLREGEHIKAWPIQSYAMPGPGLTENVLVAMLYRLSDYTRLPYAMLVIHYGIQSFQIPIPSSAKDFTVKEGGFEMPLLTLFSLENIRKYGLPQYREIDLSGTQLVKDEKFVVHGTYEDKVDR